MKQVLWRLAAGYPTRLMSCAACLFLAGCSTLRTPDPETAFRQEQPALTPVELDQNLSIFGCVSGTAYMRESQVVCFKAVIDTSNRRIERDYYFTGRDLGLLVQRTLGFVGKHGELVNDLRPETQTRFEFRHGRLTRTTGDAPPSDCGPQNAQEMAAGLLALVPTEPDIEISPPAPEAVQASNGPDATNPYAYIRTYDEAGGKVVVQYHGTPIYTYTPRYQPSDVQLGPFLDLAYAGLSDRSDKPQPRPFDDIQGRGLPQLVIRESVTGGTAGPYDNWLTILTLDGTNVVETPAVDCGGEIYYFRDFDGDGTMEIVNTDWERGFKYDAQGIPKTDSVWRYDRAQNRYRQTGDQPPDPPDTWVLSPEEKAQREQMSTNAIQQLRTMIVQDKLYPWTTIDRLDISVIVVGERYIDLVVNEIHRGDDGADPNTGPTVNFFRAEHMTGQWEVEWPAPGEGWLAYEEWLAHR